MTDLLVRDARGHELVEGCALLARALGFRERDAIPPWLVQTSASAAGGVALGAFAEGRLVGFSFAIAGEAGSLFSCGLAVDERARGRGVGRALKLAQRDRALALGVREIRWTADPLSAAALGLYLGRLHARLVGYASELYSAVRPSAVPADDVLIAWPLTGEPACASPVPADDVPIAWPPTGEPPRPLRPRARVEIPLARDRLTREELVRWRLNVRAAMGAALAGGAVGTDVAVRDGRAWVLFSEAS
jgi:predicted GNAT superfamily acetyltransferase